MTQVGTWTPENPFPGLRPFEFDQHPLFFGRDEQIDELHVRLGRSRFLAVVGPSGSGKSSLIRAGLIPALDERGPDRGGWAVAIFRPGDNPLGNLAAAVSDLEGSGPQRESCEAALRGGGDGLVEVAGDCGIGADKRLLLIVDQFEEIFRFDQYDSFSFDDAFTFVKLLLAPAMAPRQDVPIFVVLTMRADFLGACTAFQGLPEAINNGQYLIPRMTHEQLRQAIERPVAVGRAQIDAGLVERLLDDLGDDADLLPIMQHALMRTWDHWQGQGRRGPIRDEHYEAIGTISEALSQHAEEIFEALPDAESRRVAEGMFKCLTDRVDNPRGVRRPAPLSEVCAVTAADRSQVAGVADHFRGQGRWFLTPPPETPLGADTILDLSHESLMRVWKRLRDWIAEEAESAQQYQRLSHTAALYQEGRAGLYQDPDLELALNWRAQHRPTATWAQRYDPAFERAITFLEHSRKERDFLIATREEQQRRQLRRARLFASLAGVASVVFLLFLLFTLNLFFQSEENKREAIAQQRIAEEQRQEAEQQRGTAERERQNADIQRQIAQKQQQRAEEERQNAEEQRQEAEQQRETAEIQRQIAERLLRLSIARSLAAEAVEIHRRGDQGPLGTLLALQAFLFHRRSGGARLDSDMHQALRLSAEAVDPQRPVVLRGHADGVRALVFEPLRPRFYSAGDDGQLLRWGMGDDMRSEALQRHGQGLRALAVGADGALAWGGADGGLWVGRPGAKAAVRRLRPPSGQTVGAVSSLAFHGPDSLAAGHLDGSLRLWPTDGSGPPRRLLAAGRVYAVASRSTGGGLAWGGDGGQVHLEPADGIDRRLPQGAVRALRFSGSGRLLAAGSGNGDILVWDLARPGDAALSFIGHSAAVTALDFGPEEGLLVSAGLDGGLRLWDLSAPEAEPVLIQHDAWIWSAVFSPDGTRLVTAGADRTIRVWTAHASELAVDLCRRVGRDLSRREWQLYVGADIPHEGTCEALRDLLGPGAAATDGRR